MKLYWKIAVALVLIFAAGSWVGYGFGKADSRSHFDKMRKPESWESMMMNRLDEQVQLTEDQKAQIRPMLKKIGEDIFKIRKEADEKNWQAIREFYRQAEALLTEDQRKKLEESRQRLRERLKDRPPGSPGGPGGPGGPYPPMGPGGHGPDNRTPRNPGEHGTDNRNFRNPGDHGPGNWPPRNSGDHPAENLPPKNPGEKGPQDPVLPPPPETPKP